jgi:hypothetical protein
MEVLKFIKWWWQQIDPMLLAFLWLFVWIVLGGILMFTIGEVGFFILEVGLIFQLVIFILYKMITGIRNQWNNYHREKEEEAQKIVDKLRFGDRNGRVCENSQQVMTQAPIMTQANNQAIPSQSRIISGKTIPW